MAHDEDPVDELRSVGMTSAAALSRVAETMIRGAQDHKMRSAQQAAQDAEEGQRRYDAQAQVAERFYRETLDKDLIATSPRADQDALRQGAQEWAELDPDRFGPYSERLSTRFDELDQEAARRQVAGQEQRTGEEHKSRARAEAEPTKAEAGGEAGGHAGGARSDEVRNEADRANDVADDIHAEGPAYDTTQRREGTAREMTEAGVPEAQRQAKLTADHLNAEHPNTAARGGQARQKTAAKGRNVEQAKKRTKTLGRG